MPRSVSLPVPARRIGWRGLRGLVEAQDRFLDLLVSRVGERDRRAYDRESCPLQHLERSHIVTRGAGEQGPRAYRFQEQGERSAGDALPPEGPVDPVCDLGIAINDEAGDAADEPSIDGDRTGGRLWQRPDLRHVDIERGAVIGIFGREGGHLDRLGIPHLFEQGIEVGVVDRPQRHLSHKYPPTLVQRRSAGRTYQHHRTIGEDSTSAGCTTGLLGMILVAVTAWVSEWWCLSDGCLQSGWLRAGGAGVCPELVPSAAGLLAAQGDDAGGSLDGPVHAGLLGALADDRFAGCLDGTGAGEHGQ